MTNYLEATSYLDFDNANFDEFLKSFEPGVTHQETAVKLYYWVRDAFLYDPYHLDLTPSGLKGSHILSKKRAWCVEKALLLTACLRKFGIPSRLGYAIVINHIGVERLITYLRRNEIVFHGYTEVFLDNKWIKCTPAFDKRICQIAKVPTLDWDGKTDSLFQPYASNQKFMEYLHDYGTFEDLPIHLMNEEMKKYYPHLFEAVYSSKEFSFKHL